MESVKRILIISDAWYPQVNGVVRTYKEIKDTLERDGHNVRVIGPDDFYLKASCPFYKEIKLTLPFTMDKKIAAFQPDNIHIATEGPLGRVARQYCLKNNIKFTSFYHTKFPEYLGVFVTEKLKMPFLKDWIEKKAYRSLKKFHDASHGLMVTTDTMKQELQAHHFTAPIHLVTRGVNADLFHLGDKKYFQDLPKPVALYVGRVSHEKNLEDFLKMAWDGTKIVVGDGPHRTELEKKYPTAIFAGVQFGRELGDYYRAADVFVFPSLTDTFGMVMLEAMACGLPIAAYNVTGPKDIVTDKKLGALGAVGTDLSMIAQNALKHGTPQDRAAHIKNNYSWDYATQQFLGAMPSV